MLRNSKKCIIILAVLFLVISSVGPIKAEDVKDIKIHELETKLKLYDEALKELNTSSPEETAIIYAKGVKGRNGVMQYSVMSDSLKEVYKEEMWNEYWITGVSSPWVEDYRIVSKKRGFISYKITVKFNWATSAGSAGSTQEELTIAKEKGKLKIVRIKSLE